MNTEPTTAAITWRGMSRGRIAQTGCSDERPAAVAERLFNRGYLWLTIERNGAQVGGITINEGRRVWWAEP
jgi:hypothetical protein